MTLEARLQELHERAVAELIAAHQKRTDQPLLLAVRYQGGEVLDIYLLEVLGNFPGGDDDELFPMEFEPSAELRILGKLHLVLCSPAQLRTAAKRGDRIMDEFSKGVVLFDDGGRDATELKALLGL
jgi:hypothetical protein